jgi:dienelactone hydrolase
VLGREDGGVRDLVLFHSVYGLRPAVVAAAEMFRAAGHRVVTPDLYGGLVAGSIEEGFAISADVGWAAIMGRAREAVRELPGDAVLGGLSMGVGVASELHAERPDAAGILMVHGVGRVACRVPVQVHVGDMDAMFPPSEVAAWRTGVEEAEVFSYPGAGHFFTDPGPGAEEFDEAAAELTWRRAVRFVGEL